MKKSIFSYVVAVMAAVVALNFVSCSEDSDTKSKLPLFSDITFTPSTLTAGSTVKATAVQYKKGSWLNRTSYDWTIDSDEATISAQSGVMYDDDKSDPSATITLPTVSGSYTLTFTGTYRPSASCDNSTTTTQISGGTVVYTTAPTLCTVVITKKITVE